MTGPTQRPLLFLDVDGPLLPFGAAPADAALRELGSLLAALPCDLVWATTWDQTANEVIAPRLGEPGAWPPGSRTCVCVAR